MTSKAWKETMQVHDRLKRICDAATLADARALRRAASPCGGCGSTLFGQRWELYAYEHRKDAGA